MYIYCVNVIGLFIIIWSQIEEIKCSYSRGKKWNKGHENWGRNSACCGKDLEQGSEQNMQPRPWALCVSLTLIFLCIGFIFLSRDHPLQPTWKNTATLNSKVLFPWRYWNNLITFLKLSISVSAFILSPTYLLLLFKSRRYWTSNGPEWVKCSGPEEQCLVAKTIEDHLFDSCQVARLDGQTNSIFITTINSGAMI